MRAQLAQLPLWRRPPKSPRPLPASRWAQIFGEFVRVEP